MLSVGSFGRFMRLQSTLSESSIKYYEKMLQTIMHKLNTIPLTGVRKVWVENNIILDNIQVKSHHDKYSVW